MVLQLKVKDGQKSWHREASSRIAPWVSKWDSAGVQSPSEEVALPRIYRGTSSKQIPKKYRESGC